MHPDQELAQYFLKRIHHYYPIGLPHFAAVYPGFEEMQELQRKKFEAIEKEQPEAWYKLVDETRKEWSGYDVFNSVAAQFPCYELTIALNDESKTGFHYHCSLTLSISLLVPYYAIVIVDDYSYQGPKYSGVSHKVVSSGFQHHLDLDAKLNKQKDIVETYFTNQYARHNVLFNYKILGGYPYHGTYDDLGAYTIYDYLFSGGLFNQKYTVAH
jgi:hypothetical protein